METALRPAAWKTLLAFSVIYLAWGSTFYAIRVGVHEIPPFLFAAVRFTCAGLLVCLWTIFRGEASPTSRQWMSAAVLGFLIFLVDYGLLFWAERRVPSGIAAVILATIPAFMALSEIVMLRTQRLTGRLVLALLIGIGGVAVLMDNSLRLGGEPIDRAGAGALIVAAVGWSIASSLTRLLPLPASKMMSAAAQMLAGGLMLAVLTAITGEWRGVHIAAISQAAWFALAYLIFAGSIVAFTAYVWLIHHESPTKVGTYAYVNPVIAVLIGYFLGGEALGARTLLGMLLVLVSVVVITTSKAKKPAEKLGAEEIG